MIAIALLGMQACRASAPTTAVAEPAVTPSPASTPAPRSIRRVPIDAPGLFAEGLAWDAPRSRLLLGGIVGQAIVASDLSAAPAQRVAAPAAGWSVFGLAIDVERGWLWAACSAVPQGQLLPHDRGRAGLVAFALADGAQIHAWETEDDAGHVLGDVALASDGTAYTTDSQGGGVYAASTDRVALREVMPAGSFRSPQGIIALDDHALLLADYSTGLVRVELDGEGVARSHALLRSAAGDDLRGVDGIARRDRTVIAVQNGAAPPRVLAITLTQDLAGIAAASVLHVPEVDDGEPTLVTIVGDDAWVVQTDRWDRVFDGDGRPRGELAIASPVVLQIPLPGT